METNQSNEEQINNQFNQQFGGSGQGNQPLPNATAVLVLGILSIVTCWLYGLPGLIMGIIGLVLSNKAKQEYEKNPSAYSLTSFNNMKAGRICAIIGLCVSALFFLYIIVVLAFVGAVAGFGLSHMH